MGIRLLHPDGQSARIGSVVASYGQAVASHDLSTVLSVFRLVIPAALYLIRGFNTAMN